MRHSIVHRVLLDFLRYCDSSSRAVSLTRMLKTGHLLFHSFACYCYCLLGDDRAVERDGSGDSAHKRWLQSSSAVSLAWNSQGLCTVELVNNAWTH